MSNAGRPRVPTKLKIIRGTARKDRTVANELEGEPIQDFTAPEGLNEWGRQEWDRIVGLLKHTEVITTLDTSALYSLCNEWGKYMEAEMLLKKNGRVVKSPNNFPMVHPYDTISGQSFKRYKEMAVQFGLTPASRTRISIPDKNKHSTPEDLLKAI